MEWTLRRLLTVCWAIAWRGFVVGFLVGALVGFLVGFVIGAIQGARGLPVDVGPWPSLAGLVFGIPIWIWSVKSAMQAKYRGFRIALVPPPSA